MVYIGPNGDTYTIQYVDPENDDVGIVRDTNSKFKHSVRDRLYCPKCRTYMEIKTFK